MIRTLCASWQEMPRFGRGERRRWRLAIPGIAVRQHQASSKKRECGAQGEQHQDAIINSAWCGGMLDRDLFPLCGGRMRFAAQVTHKSHAPRGRVLVRQCIDDGAVQHAEERVEDSQHQCNQHRQAKALRCQCQSQARRSAMINSRQYTLHHCALYHKVWSDPFSDGSWNGWSEDAAAHARGSARTMPALPFVRRLPAPASGRQCRVRDGTMGNVQGSTPSGQ